MIEEAVPASPDNTSHADKKALTAASWRIVALLAGFAVIGSFIGAMTIEKTLFLYKEQMGLTPGGVSTLALWLGIPTYLQPFIGAGSDLYPIMGYHRRSYYIICTVLCAAGYFGLALLHTYPYMTVLFLLLIAGAGSTVIGVIVNAVMVTVGNSTGRQGQLQSLSYFLPSLLSVAYAAHLGGYITQHWSYFRAFGDCAGLILLTIPLVFLIDEKPVIDSETAHADAEIRNAAKKREHEHSVAALKAATKEPGLWAIVAFIFYLILTPAPNNALIYFESDSLHFSKQFIGDLGKYGNFGTIIAVAVFAALSRRMSVRSLVWGAWLTDCLLFPTNLIMHDHTTAIISYYTSGFFGVWYALCLNTLAARACPRGVEGTIYGLIMSAIAFSGNMSNWLGGHAYDYFGPTNHAHHWSEIHAWVDSNYFGLIFTLIGFIFIPLLPKWAKSKQLLSEEPEQYATAA